MPLPDVQTATSTAIHAHCLLLYFLAGWNAAPLCAPASRCFFNCFGYHLLFALRLVSSCPLPKIKGLGSVARRYGVCIMNFGAAPFRRAHEISPRQAQRSQDSASPESSLHGHPDCRRPLLLFTRTICYLYKQVIDTVHSSTHSNPAAFCTTRAL